VSVLDTIALNAREKMFHFNSTGGIPVGLDVGCPKGSCKGTFSTFDYNKSMETVIKDFNEGKTAEDKKTGDDVLFLKNGSLSTGKLEES